MADMLIRDIAPEVMERLKNQAAAKGHSMQVEAKSIIEAGVQLTIEEWVAMVRRSSAEMERKHGAIVGSSAELIREGREERDRAIEEALERHADAGGLDARTDPDTDGGTDE